MMPSEGSQSSLYCQHVRSASAAESLQEYGAEQWQPASGVWQKGIGRANSSGQYEPPEGRDFDGSELGFTWFYSSLCQKRKLHLPAFGICNKHCAPNYTSASASRNPACDSCPTCEARCRSYQHLAALTHPSSWASSAHLHHLRLI